MPDIVGLEQHKPTSLRGIAKKAKADKQHRFRDLYRELNAGFLLACWRDLNKKAASGVDKVTADGYTRLLNPDKRHEAITSRPLMLESVGRKTSHAGQTTVTITSSHAKATVIQAAMRELTAFFKELTRTAEQLGIPERIALIAKRAYRKMLPVLTPADTLKLLPSTG